MNTSSKSGDMSPRRELGFLISDVARLLRHAVDQEAGALGTSRAQWVVLVRIKRQPGLSQIELAQQVDIAPITLTRLLDRLESHGLVERRHDKTDRRIRRLYLTDAAEPVLATLARTGEALMAETLEGLADEDIALLAACLGRVRNNLKHRSLTRGAPAA
jgi:MarR family transcriptional regulator for hemolysin